MKRSSRKQNLFGYHGQAIVEFAIALPILLALLVGIFEVGRMMFIYTAVTNASREAVRYASAVGLDDSGSYNKYRYCAGIKEMARRSAYFTPLTVTITYDHGPGTAVFDTCSGSVDPAVVVNSGTDADRVLVEVTANYSPMVNLIPIDPQVITSKSARTILGLLELDSPSGPTNTPGGPTNTPGSPTNTPTATVPSNTPTNTATNTGPIVTLTPILTNTPTRTPTITPTFTPSSTPTVTRTPTPTFTPTTTPTAVPGCDSITRGAIIISDNTMSMAITNPHDSVTVLDVRVVWNSSTGAPGGQSGSTLTLQYASLGVQFWTGSNSTGDLLITPSTTVTIPGNNATSTIIFTFDKQYKNLGTTIPLIVINLSTPGCENFPIRQP